MHAHKVWEVTHPDGKLSLAGFVKRTYDFGAGGRVTLADRQDPVVDEPDIDIGDDDTMRDLYDDTDLVAPKLATDVIVRGTVVLPAPATEHRIGVAVGKSARALRLTGPRRADVGDSVRFAPAASFERVALDHRLAYGGYDRYAQESLAPWLDPLADDRSRLGEPRPVGVFAYPRNAVGTAYFVDVDRARADGAVLPQIEDPRDLLHPDRFFVPKPTAWIDAPLPGSLGWMPHACYPRIVRLVGPLLPHDPPKHPIRETTFADGDDLVEPAELPAGRVHPRALQGASPGLAIERLRGDELMLLEGLLPDQPSARVELPGEAPLLKIAAPGLAAVAVKSVLQTLRVDLDRRTLSLTWCGTVRLLANVDEQFLEQTVLSIDWRRV